MKNREKIIGSIVIVCIFACFLIVGFLKGRSTGIDEDNLFVEKENNSITATTSDTSLNKYIKVEIKGSVNKPGVYTLPNGSRVEELVERAGGFTETADKNNIVSLAKKLRDEECIIIRDKSEITTTVKTQTNSSSIINGRNAEGKININIASKDELKTVPGIGDVTAQKIIDYREKFGEFNSIEDLKKIDRIGDKTLNNIRDKIDVN